MHASTLNANNYRSSIVNRLREHMFPVCAQCHSEHSCLSDFRCDQTGSGVAGPQTDYFWHAFRLSFWMARQFMARLCLFFHSMGCFSLFHFLSIVDSCWRRSKQRPALRLVHMGEDYIGRMHGADLATKYNPVSQGHSRDGRHLRTDCSISGQAHSVNLYSDHLSATRRHFFSLLICNRFYARTQLTNCRTFMC